MRLFTVTLLAVAATILPTSGASAICSEAYRAVTGDCSPCHTLQRVRPDTICVQ